MKMAFIVVRGIVRCRDKSRSLSQYSYNRCIPQALTICQRNLKALELDQFSKRMSAIRRRKESTLISFCFA